MLQDVTVLNVDRRVAEVFGTMRADMLDRGRPIPSVDLMIAATARTHNLTVVTHNARHFTLVPDLDIEDSIKSEN